MIDRVIIFLHHSINITCLYQGRILFFLPLELFGAPVEVSESHIQGVQKGPEILIRPSARILKARLKSPGLNQGVPPRP